MNPPPLNRLYEYQNLNKITSDDGSRVYDTPSGKLPSVTTILSQTGDKTGLKEWRQRVGEKEANRVTKEASGLGTLLHTHLENYIEGKERPGGNNLVRQLARNMADVVIECGMPCIDELWGYEEPLYYPGLYAGTADLILVHEGEPAIGDFKTARKMKKEEWIKDYFLQLVAYSLAHNELYGTNIKSGVIFMVDRDLNFKKFAVSGKQFDEYADEWIERLEDFYASRM